MTSNRKKWKLQGNTEDGDMMILGDRATITPLPDKTLISITYSKNANILQGVLSVLFQFLFIIPNMSKNDGLLYAELIVDMKTRDGLTISVWKDKALVPFRDKGSHGFAIRKLGWVLTGFNMTSHFLSIRPIDGQIPTPPQAKTLAEGHGKTYHKGKVIRSASRIH